MKIRIGFVSNSSSTAFIITNKTKGELPLRDFVEEAKALVRQFVNEYEQWDIDHKYEDPGDRENAAKLMAEEMYDAMLGDCRSEPPLKPGDNYCVFGDEQQTTLGRVYDYILRGGGETERFQWRFEEYLR